MSKAATAALSLVVGALAGWAIVQFVYPAGGGPPGAKKDQWKNEFALIVLKDDQGTCKVKERRPQAIYTESSSTVTWIIVGSCQNAPPVAIDRRFEVSGGGTQEVFTQGSSLTTTAQNGHMITATVLPNLTPDDKPVHFEYTILINNQPAEYASRADRGEFAVCPDWPCSRGR